MASLDTSPNIVVPVPPQAVSLTFAPYRYSAIRHLLRYGGCLLLSALLLFPVYAQLPEKPAIPIVGSAGEQQMENLTMTAGDVVAEDDSYQQQLRHRLSHPLNLNTADEAALQELGLLTALQISHLLNYRRLLGPLVSLYELQAVPGWDIETIQRLRPYSTVQNPVPLLNSLRQRLRGGTHRLLLRIDRVLEPAKGYRSDSGNRYLGSPYKMQWRYRYIHPHGLQYGLLGEKDAGEQFFKGRQRLGFDFYSGHFFVRRLGIVQALAIGDFTVNLGQGLIQWQSMAFQKGGDLLNIQRQAPVLRPYHSAGEANFHRGLGITLGKGPWQATFFASQRRLDANGVADTLHGTHVSSLLTSGYHRSPAELADKGIQRQTAWGGNLTWRHRRWRWGINWVQHRFALPIRKALEPYNLFAFTGRKAQHYGIQYSYTYRNAHFFGEAAIGNPSSGSGGKALISGCLASLSAQVDIALLYRHIGRGYHAINGHAFTEASQPGNERGLYAAIQIRPAPAWRLGLFVDSYRFPWLRYSTDAPAQGMDYWLQATYHPHKALEIDTRYRAAVRPVNSPAGERPLAEVVARPWRNWRTQLHWRPARGIAFRGRAEAVWYDPRGSMAEQGFLLLGDLLYSPLQRPFSIGVRLQYFETDGYASRLYAYENDVPYSFSIPVFYDKGFRCYLNLQASMGKRFEGWLRLAQTRYTDRMGLGSGLDAIAGNRRTEVKIQVQYSF
jgi:hypothetical protein